MSSPGIPVKTNCLTPFPPVAPMLYLLYFHCLTSSSITHYTHSSIIWQIQGSILHLLLPLTARTNTPTWVKVMTWRPKCSGHAPLCGQCRRSCVLPPGTVTSAPAEGALKDGPLLVVHRITLNSYFSQA